jgi:ABC-type nitrate/sulfonate/bicarbonate transport system substrate-binding protein
MLKCRSLRSLATLVAVIVSMVGTMLLPQGATAQQPVTVRLVIGVSDTSRDGYFAFEGGFFKKNGLNVELTQARGGAAEAAAIAGGAADIGDGNLISYATAITKGIPFVAIAAGVMYDSRDPYAVLAVAPDSPYKTAKDLEGKIIGEPSLGGMGEAAIAAWADLAGADWKTYKYVEIPAPETIAALRQGTIAASVMQDPQFLMDGDKIRVLARNYDVIAKRFMTTAWYSTKDYVAKNPDVIRRFALSINQGAAWADKNPPLARAALEKWLKIKDARFRHGHVDTLDPALVQPMLDFAAKYKFLPRPVAASEMIYTAPK